MKTNILKNSFQLILWLSLLSCSNKEVNDITELENIRLEKTSETASFSAYEDVQGSKNNKHQNLSENYQIRIVKNADCRIKVAHVSGTIQKIKQLVKAYEGYVADERFTQTNYVRENKFTIRIPQKYFDKGLDSICLLAEFVDHKNITTLDVSEEYVDISARLQTKLEVKDRYETILRSKAKTVEDLLITEEKLKDIQEEIESAKGRLAYLTNKVSYSTIQVDVYETVIPKEEPDQYEPAFLDKAKQGISFGWDAVSFVILILFYIWPLVCIGFIVFGYYKWIRK